MDELKKFLRKNDACRDGYEWAIRNCTSLHDMWEKLPSAPNKTWMMWVATQGGVFSDIELRLLACKIVRTTPAGNGKTVWDLLTDERSRNAVEVAERYANGEATDEELSAAWAAARAAADADAWDHINKLLTEMGSPFKEVNIV